MKLRDMQGLGPKSEQHLMEVGIKSPEALKNTGAVEAYLRLKEEGKKPGMNFLYAMVGALEGRPWLEIARSERERLLMSLEGYAELEAILELEGIK